MEIKNRKVGGKRSKAEIAKDISENVIIRTVARETSASRYKIPVREKYGKWIEGRIEERLDEIEGWARMGYSHDKIAELLNIHLSTLQDWCKDVKKSAFRRAVYAGREDTKGKVFKALKDTAVGYFIQEQAAFKVKSPYLRANGEIATDRNGRVIYTETVIVVDVKRWIQPNVNAQIFLLANLDNKAFRRQDGEVFEDDVAAKNLADAIKRSRELLMNKNNTVTDVSGNRVQIMNEADAYKGETIEIERGEVNEVVESTPEESKG